jgi:hypothetical protein
MDVQVDTFLTSAPGRGEWSASHPGSFIPGNGLGTTLPQSQCGHSGEKKNILLLPRTEPRLLGPPACGLVATTEVRCVLCNEEIAKASKKLKKRTPRRTKRMKERNVREINLSVGYAFGRCTHVSVRAV